jgi:dipeptidyl aminopeptidase/acylaminoacyl peptidase
MPKTASSIKLKANSKAVNSNLRLAVTEPRRIKASLSVDDLWSLERLNTASLSPTGTRVCASVTSYDMNKNSSRSSLWLFATPKAPQTKPSTPFKPAATMLTTCGEKDSSPIWSPNGKLIAFVAKRQDDKAPQIYLINPDGGEAKRLTQLSTGVSSIQWLNDGQHIAFISWVWPELKSDKEQAQRIKVLADDKVKATITESDAYRYWDHFIADGNEPKVHLVNVKTGKVQNLMERTDVHLPLADPGTNHYAFANDSKTLAFVFNPLKRGRGDTCFKIALVDLKSARLKVLNPNDEFDYSSPVFSPDDKTIACVRSPFGEYFNAPRSMALLNAKTGEHQASSATRSPISPVLQYPSSWDREPNGDHQWTADGTALVFTAEDLGRQNLYRVAISDHQSKAPVCLAKGGTIQAFNMNALGDLATLSHSLMNPVQMHFLQAELSEGTSEHKAINDYPRLDTLNEKLLRSRHLGHTQEHWYKGANGDKVQAFTRRALIRKRSTRCCTPFTAGRTRALVIFGITAGTPKCLRLTVMSSLVCNTTAQLVLDRPLKTPSRVSGASLKRRTSMH